MTADEKKRQLREIVVISGKGGTGKTSVAASFAALAKNAVLADCDVDAADLHLILKPNIMETHEFYNGREAVIRRVDCARCGTCMDTCRFGAVKIEKLGNGEISYSIDPVSCEGCGVCVRFCPAGAIDFPERRCGEWMISETRFGPMVHAKLGIAAENSGKLVSTVRREARGIAEKRGASLIIVDGPPGIGCPVIASITGASQALVVTEPTVSGEHDLARALELVKHFGIPAFVCVNKWDINPETAGRIEKKAVKFGAKIAGRIRYDRSVTTAQLAEKSAVEAEAPSAEDIKNIWLRMGV